MDIPEADSSNDFWSIIWGTFENASLTYDLASCGNGTKIDNPDENDYFEYATKLGIITGLFLSWLADIQIIPTKFDHSIKKLIQGIFFVIINTIFFMILAPIIAPLLICFFMYRRIIHLILKYQIGEEYAGLLEGTDCVWAVEDSAYLSVINILAILEISKETRSIHEINLVEDFRSLVKNRLISADIDKLCWIKEKKYGYFYWRKSNNVNLEERIRWLDNNNDHKNCDGTCDDLSSGYLKKAIAEMSNKPLAQNHSRCWEILIPKKCPKMAINNCQERKRIPLIFRVHHVLGDGVALLRLLLEVIADTKNLKAPVNQAQLSLSIDSRNENQNSEVVDDKRFQLPILQRSSSLYENYRQSSNVIYYSSDLLGITMPFSTSISFKSMIDYLQKYLRELARYLVALILIPHCLFSQVFRCRDKSGIHGPKLSGNKIVSSWMEDDSISENDYGLIKKIRNIKNATGTRFGDVVLAALSAALHNYFLQKEERSPNSLTVVMPARMTLPSPKLSLKNRFSVGILTLCVSEVNGVRDNRPSNDPSRTLDRLRDVTSSIDKLRGETDYLINYWIMKYLCSALPEKFLKPFLQSESTMIFSNLPGPRSVLILGHELKNVAFWIPHRGTTGFGFSFLTYDEKAHFSVIADRAVINDENALDEILNGTIDNIEQLHANITLRCFKK